MAYIDQQWAMATSNYFRFETVTLNAECKTVHEQTV